MLITNGIEKFSNPAAKPAIRVYTYKQLTTDRAGDKKTHIKIFFFSNSLSWV